MVQSGMMTKPFWLVTRDCQSQLNSLAPSAHHCCVFLTVSLENVFDGQFWSNAIAAVITSEVVALQIISGKGNPLAKAAARGEASQEKAMQQAAAYDLDILQRLAVTETTLSGDLTADHTVHSVTVVSQSRSSTILLPFTPCLQCGSVCETGSAS